MTEDRYDIQNMFLNFVLTTVRFADFKFVVLDLRNCLFGTVDLKKNCISKDVFCQWNKVSVTLKDIRPVLGSL